MQIELLTGGIVLNTCICKRSGAKMTLLDSRSHL